MRVRTMVREKRHLQFSLCVMNSVYNINVSLYVQDPEDMRKRQSEENNTTLFGRWRTEMFFAPAKHETDFAPLCAPRLAALERAAVSTMPASCHLQHPFCLLPLKPLYAWWRGADKSFTACNVVRTFIDELSTVTGKKTKR